MTSFTTNARTDLNIRGHRMRKARETAESQVWRLTDLIPTLVAGIPPHAEEAIAKAARREAARRSVDNLLRRA